jgi:hypothetical protein
MPYLTDAYSSREPSYTSGIAGLPLTTSGLYGRILRMDVDVRFMPHIATCSYKGTDFSRFKAAILRTEHQLWYTSGVEIGDLSKRSTSHLHDPAILSLTIITSATRP